MRYFASRLLSTTGIILAMVAPMAAQATRTGVSGVGDDANPCSRTAPCKTFAGAISKTAAGGEIDALDPGGFGALTITKSITVDGGGGTVAGVLASGTNGIVISAGATDVIVLRNLSISGAVTSSGTDTRGIKFLSGKTLVVDQCEVFQFAKRNVSIESSTPNAQAWMTNTRVFNGLNNGIVVAPPSGISNQLVMNNVQSVSNAAYGLGNNVGGTMQCTNCVISNNGAGGLLADDSQVDLHSTMISGNINGIVSQDFAVVRISDVTVVGNSAGLTALSSGVINSFGDNQIAGNSSGNSGVTPISRQ